VLRLADILAARGVPVLKLHRPEGGHATHYADTCEALEFCIRESRKEGGAAGLIFGELRRIQQRMAALPAGAGAAADAIVFAKAVEWALRYEPALTPGDGGLLKRFLIRAEERLAGLETGRMPWLSKRGKRVGGFVSAVDGSIQPYGLVVPGSYDGSTPVRLDVVLHGSSRPVGMSEAKFMARFEEGDTGGAGPDAPYLELHPLGRVENGYRWAGETDVFEAIAAVCRVCRVDPDRIVLRGMSMGASGTWHLGLKHPGRFVALAPYCGYVDTHRFSQTPLPNFIRVGPLPPHQEMGLHMLDSVDYAANAGVVPAVAAIGDKDVFWDSHVHMGEAFHREGLNMQHLVSHGTGHVQDPATHREQMRRVGEYAQRGMNRDPQQIRFVTWTLKYAQCHWLEVLGLEKHYQRAEVRAGYDASGRLSMDEITNVTRFAVHRPVMRVFIEGAEVPLPVGAAQKPGLVFVKGASGWVCAGFRSEVALSGKQPGLQGPIDDALTRPFVCVRGTGRPWNSSAHAWSMAALKRLEYEWPRYMRGDLPVRDDTAVSEADLAGKNILLFGDPGSNALLVKLLPDLPVRWTPQHVELGGETFDSQSHVPALIAPNPSQSGCSIVVNCGHSFGEKEFASLNYLLFPRLGDCAVIRIAERTAPPQPAAAAEPLTPFAGFVQKYQRPVTPPFVEEVVRAGYFDEAWREALWVKP
jgi:hypothetical protein